MRSSRRNYNRQQHSHKGRYELRGPIITNKRTIIDENLSDERTVVLPLYLLAKDSEEKADATEMDTVYPDTYRAGEANFVEQYKYYSGVDSSVSWELDEFISKRLFWDESTLNYTACCGEVGR